MGDITMDQNTGYDWNWKQNIFLFRSNPYTGQKQFPRVTLGHTEAWSNSDDFTMEIFYRCDKASDGSTNQFFTKFSLGSWENGVTKNFRWEIRNTESEMQFRVLVDGV